MLERNSNSFDDRVRSLLEDAEVKAPRRVWRGVSASLDAAAAWWKWAAAGLVAASVLAGGLFFGGVFDKTQEITGSPAVAEVTVVDEPVVPAAQFNPTYQNINKRLAATVKSDVTEAAEATGATAAAEPESVKAEPESDKAEPQAALTDGGSESSETWSDPFAEMEREDAAKARRFRSRLALSLEGAASGNDSDFGDWSF